MIFDLERTPPFWLDSDFLVPFSRRPVKWGFGALSWVVYKRSYSRDGEEWWQTCRRVIEGMFTVLKIHTHELALPWDEAKMQAMAQDCYARFFDFKWTPPGRGLWTMGAQFMYERGGAALNNCGFVSTQNIDVDFADPFLWMFRMAMFGVGVGFDTRGRGKVRIVAPMRGPEPHVVADSREGWAEALERLLNAFVGKGALPAGWDFSKVRPKGTPLKAFGGLASGPEPLAEMLTCLEQRYRGYIDRPVDAALIVDTMNLVGRCVVAGGIRRTAQIAFGDPDDVQFRELKADKELLRDFRWVSNNSVIVPPGTDYTELVKLTSDNGEPGYFWLENARRNGRMGQNDGVNGRDEHALGSNPCVEQTLWDHELCCLVETYPAHHDDPNDFLQTLRCAYFYAKTVTLVPTEDKHTNAVMLRNRRIGCSMTGIVQAINKFGYRAFFDLCDAGYRYIQALDKELSDRLCIPRSIKTTSVKPSGSVSLLAGATPGVHWDHAPYYIRRVRVAAYHPLAEMCERAGYPVEEDAYKSNAVVISFPVHVPFAGRSKSEVSLREKVDLAAQMQRFWSDNQVSCTAEFDPQTEKEELARILQSYDDRLKAIVFLPSEKHGYVQPPYEAITYNRYVELVGQLKPIEGTIDHEHEHEALFCDGATCEIDRTDYAGAKK